jgi:hypothetical protein
MPEVSLYSLLEFMLLPHTICDFLDLKSYNNLYMAVIYGAGGTKRPFLLILLPSWLSTFVLIMFGIIILAGPALLVHFGNTLQQSLLGVHTTYGQTTLAGTSHTISNHFLTNTYVGDTTLFLLWGLVGLVVYLIASSIITELFGANDLVREFSYNNVDKLGLLRELFIHSVVRIVSLAIWWFTLSYFIFHLIPYTIAASHISGTYLTSLTDWARSIGAMFGCLIFLHVLTVLLRLMVLHPRLFSNQSQ